jgi:hypothetical protein
MLLNADPSPLIPAGNRAAPDAVAAVARPAPLPATPPSGRALLALLEWQAQRELAALQAGQPPAPAPPDPALACIGWDLGLGGDALGAAQP